MTESIGKIIKKNRLDLKLTLDDVAKAVGVSKSTVQRWESGKINNMRRDRIDLLSKILQVSPLILLGNDSPTINTTPAELPERSELKMTFYYKKFKSLRKDSGMSQLEVAQKLGLAKSTIAMYESGKRTPDFETIDAICDLFNVNMSELSDSKLATKYENLNAVQPAFHLTPNDSKKKSIVYDRIHDIQPQIWHEPTINEVMETLKARELFSKRLRTLLNTHNMNQNELAKILNVSESTVGKWVLGKSMPRTMGIIQTIADNFGVGKSFLLEETPVEDSPAPSYYSDPAVAEMAEELKNNPGMKMLFDASRNASQKDLEIAANLLKQLKGDDE